MENETNNLPEEPKGPNKTLIIILSIVGAVVLLGGIGTVVLFKTVINKGKDLINSAQETQNKMIEEAKEEQDKMAEEARKQQKEVIDNIKESVTLLDYSDNGFTIKVQGMSSKTDGVSDAEIYVNGQKFENEYFNRYQDNYETFEVEKIGDVYVLLSGCPKCSTSLDKAYVFDVNGNLVKELPNDEDDENLIHINTGYGCDITTENNEILLNCGRRTAYVSCKGDIESYDFHYKVNGNEVILDHIDQNYYEKDSIEETCNEKRNNP